MSEQAMLTCLSFFSAPLPFSMVHGSDATSGEGAASASAVVHESGLGCTVRKQPVVSLAYLRFHGVLTCI